MAELKLTKAQVESLEEKKVEWIAVGNNTDMADVEKGEHFIKKFYRTLGRPEPIILNMSSPGACEFLAGTLPKKAETAKMITSSRKSLLETEKYTGDERVCSALASSAQAEIQVERLLKAVTASKKPFEFGKQIGGLTRWQLEDQLSNKFKEKYSDSSSSDLFKSVNDIWNLFNPITTMIRNTIGNQKATRPFTNNAVTTQSLTAWYMFYMFGKEIGAEFPTDDIVKLDAMADVSRTVGWMSPWENICLFSDRPSAMRHDELGRLHSLEKATIEFRDGWGCYAYNGLIIPGEWIYDKKSLSAKTALTWANIEQRRAAIEIVSWAKILKDLDAKVIDEDGDPLIGTLVEVELPGIGPSRFCKVLCGTGREFAVGVPRQVKTAIEAQAWMQGVEMKDFTRPEVRT